MTVVERSGMGGLDSGSGVRCDVGGHAFGGEP